MHRRAFLALATAALARPAQQRAGRGSLIYAGAFPGKIVIMDEAQEKIIAEVPTQTGIPRNIRLSYDKKKLYVFTARGGIEVFDLASRKITNHFVLDEGARSVRVRGGMAPDPDDKLLFTLIHVAVRQIDRFEIEKPKLAVIDLEQKKITRTADLPADEESLGWGADFRVSPDGSHLYAFQQNVLILNTSDFKVAEKIELSRPLYPGMATIGFGLWDEPYEERDSVTGVFNSTDPIVRRSIFGIARFDLNKRTFDFTPVGPAAGGMMGLRLAPGGKTGYTVAFQGDVGNRRSEFWEFEMATRKVARRVEFDGPVNFRFTISGDGRQIYIHGTSPFVEIYDAATLTKKKTLDLNVDLTTGLLVLPGNPAGG